MKKRFIKFVFIFFFFSGAIAQAKLTPDEIGSLFNQANDSFKKANAAAAESDRIKLYDETILRYEKITNEGEIKNSKLYYNLANAYLLKDEIGKAILNYRRAEKLNGSDVNIKKNLSFARSRRIDQVEIKAEKQILQTLFFWHYDFSLKTKFTAACVFFGLFCIVLIFILWKGLSASKKSSAVVLACLTIAFLSSVITEINAQKPAGVITAKKVIARQGDGQNYQASFKEPLHEGIEFELLENRTGWLNIKLSDGSEGWIPENSAEII